MKAEKVMNKKNRDGEKGAALVMVLLISMLLLVASAGLLLESSMNTANVTDSTAEQQAYNAAESGIQDALDVLRGNVTPNPLLDTTQPASHPNNQINFIKAITPGTSNKSGDTTTFGRLSRWLNYSQTNTDRIILGNVGSYTANNGYAYKLSISDPDDATTHLEYKTSGNIVGAGVTSTSSGVTTYSENGVTIKYTAKSTTNIVFGSTGISNTDYGSFNITGPVMGGTLSNNVRFSINVTMSAPYQAVKEIRGWIKKGSLPITNTSLGGAEIIFDSETFVLMGSNMIISGLAPYQSTTSPTIGYNFKNPPTTTPTNITLNGTISAAEPVRVLVRSTGYGPRGAKKELEAVVQKNFFNGMSAPATLTLVGPQKGSVFNPGSSNVTQYSGVDVVSSVLIPPIGTTNQALLTDVIKSVNGEQPHPFNGTVVGTPSDVTAEIPWWLQNPTNLDKTISDLRAVAYSSGGYYSNGAVPSVIGNNTTGRGITFVDGDLDFQDAGGGILVVTGTLTLNGNFSFKGLIIVTGSGGVLRKGGGNGTIQGNIVVAPYNKNDLTAGFLPPQYDLSGGGDSTIIYNSNALSNGMIAVSNFVLGVAEK